jgi:oligopeptidase B
MKFLKATLLASIIIILFSCYTETIQLNNSGLNVPIAEIKPESLEIYGDTRVDNYYWLKDRENPQVIEYIKSENAYTDTVMLPTKEFQETLFAEIKGRIKQDDSSVPHKLDDYYYYKRYERGQEYPIYCRKKGSLAADEEIMLDVNQMAVGHDYFSVTGQVVSWEQDLLAFAVDTLGRRFYTIQFKNLTSGEILQDIIPSVIGNMAWANDNKTLFYVKQDPNTLRSFQIYKHIIGTDSEDDKLVYEEKDETFSCYVWRTKSKKYIMIGSFQTLSSEIRYLDANKPHDKFKIFLPREKEHEYEIDHFKNDFYIRSNQKAKNFRLMKTPVTKTGKENWQEVIPQRDDVFLSDFDIFSDYLVLSERKKGLTQIHIIAWYGQNEHYLEFAEPAYLAYPGTNPDFNTTILRYRYTSMTTPHSVYDYDMGTRERKLLKQDEVLGGFNSDDYITERLYAKAGDGVEIPLSLVYRKDMKNVSPNPLLLYAYGSYGSSMDATFNAARLSLLDRGFIYAIAHVRGGQELGREWYEDGKLLNKKNTFTDFIDCAKYLVKENYTNPDILFCRGGSAGGLLIGAVINMAPNLFRGAIAAVPWVDVVTTMLDETIPLTTSEYDEWGNPNEKEYYDYMLSYSPYDNITAKEYPNLLVTTSMHDSQVQYWEPVKWVAKLRSLKTDQNILILKTEMVAGHGGVSGRYKKYKEIAFRYAFLLVLAGITK